MQWPHEGYGEALDLDEGDNSSRGLLASTVPGSTVRVLKGNMISYQPVRAVPLFPVSVTAHSFRRAPSVSGERNQRPNE